MSVLVKSTPDDLVQIVGQIRSASSIKDLTEVRARIEAARSWARVHKNVSDVRLDLLRVEVEALVRIVELGGVETLPPKDRRAARKLALLSAADRQALVAESGSATTAAGMMRSLWQAEDLARERARNRDLGRALAEHPGGDLPSDGDRRQLARDTAYKIEYALADALERITAVGEPFTVGEVADEIIAATSTDRIDPAVEEGVREVTRAAIRRAPVVEFDGTILPRIITARTEHGAHVRVPVENALLSHLDQMCADRREQIAHDQAALAKLDRVAGRLRAMPGAQDDSRIGDLIGLSLRREAS